MPYVTVGKKTELTSTFTNRDWGKGQPIVFGHGWSLSTAVFENQMSLSERRNEEEA